MAIGNNIDKKIEDALQSMDNHNRARPAPFLATRIHAKLLSEKKPNAWDKFYSVITRPVVAVGGMAIIVLLNILIITSNDNSESIRFQADANNNEWQGYSTAVTSALYDENIEP